MKNRIISFALTIVMLFTILPSTGILAKADETPGSVTSESNESSSSENDLSEINQETYHELGLDTDATELKGTPLGQKCVVGENQQLYSIVKSANKKFGVAAYDSMKIGDKDHLYQDINDSEFTAADVVYIKCKATRISDDDYSASSVTKLLCKDDFCCLETYRLKQDGTEDSNSKISSSSFYVPSLSTIIGNNGNYSSVVDMTVSDLDGDGIDECIVSMPYETDSGNISRIRVFSIKGDSWTQEDYIDLPSDSGYCPIVSLCSGDLMRKGNDCSQLFIGYSYPRSCSASSCVMVYDFSNDLTNGKMVYEKNLSHENYDYLGINMGNLLPASVSNATSLVVAGIDSSYNIHATTIKYDSQLNEFAEAECKINYDGNKDNTITKKYYEAENYNYLYPISVGCAALKGKGDSNNSQDSVMIDRFIFGYEQSNSLNLLYDTGAGAGRIYSVESIQKGNITNDPNGCESFICTTLDWYSKKDHDYDDLHTTCFLFNGTNVDENTVDYSKDLKDNINYIKSGYSGLKSNSSYIESCVVNYKKDSGTNLKLLSLGIVYTNPSVMAVLEAPPYYKELAQSFPDEYPNQANTTYSLSKSNGTTSGHTGTWSAGVYTHTEVSLGGGGEFETETTYNGSYEVSNSTEITTSVDYQTTADDDCVVLTVVPYMTYIYGVDGKSDETVVRAYPIKIENVITPVTKYDDIANKTKGLEPIRGNILHNIPGDPATYTSWPNNTKLDLQADGEKTAISGSSSANITLSGEKVTSTEDSTEHGFEINVKIGGGFSLLGNKAEAGIVGGGGASWNTGSTHSDSVSFAGTVDNLPEGADNYGFNWTIANRTYTDSNNNKIPVICYKTDTVISGTPIPNNLQVENVTSSSVTLSWDNVPQATDYKIYRKNAKGDYDFIKKVTANHTDTETATITDLEPNTMVDYKISSVCEYDESLQSNNVTTSTLPVTYSNINFEIVTQPQDINTKIGEQATFTTKADFSGEKTSKIRYQWFEKSPGSRNFTLMQNETSENLNITADILKNNGSLYYCKAYLEENTNVTVSSDIARLTVSLYSTQITLKDKDSLQSTIYASNGTEKTVVAKVTTDGNIKATGKVSFAVTTRYGTYEQICDLNENSEAEYTFTAHSLQNYSREYIITAQYLGSDKLKSCKSPESLKYISYYLTPNYRTIVDTDKDSYTTTYGNAIDIKLNSYELDGTTKELTKQKTFSKPKHFSVKYYKQSNNNSDAILSDFISFNETTGIVTVSDTAPAGSYRIQFANLPSDYTVFDHTDTSQKSLIFSVYVTVKRSDVKIELPTISEKIGSTTDDRYVTPKIEAQTKVYINNEQFSYSDCELKKQGYFNICSTVDLSQPGRYPVCVVLQDKALDDTNYNFECNPTTYTITQIRHLITTGNLDPNGSITLQYTEPGSTKIKTIDDLTTRYIPENSKLTFIPKPNANYSLYKWTIDGKPLKQNDK